MTTELLLMFRSSRGSLYPSLYLDSYTDSSNVDLVRCRRYDVSEEEICETAYLAKHVHTFLVLTDDVERALKTKYLWNDDKREPPS